MDAKGKGLRALSKSNKPRPKIKKEFKARKITVSEIVETPLTCTCCGKTFKTRKGNFLRSASVLFTSNDGYVPICKRCLDSYYEQLMEFFNGDEDSCIERLCQLFDVYYNAKIVEHTLMNARGNVPKFSVYLSQINLRHNKEKGTDYLHSLIDEAEEAEEAEETFENNQEEIETNKEKTNNIDSFIEENPEDSEENLAEPEIEITPELRRKWGGNHTAQEYAFLEDEYDGWITYLGWTEKPQLELIKGLCWAQLDIRKCGEGNSDKRSAALKAYQDLLGTCNLKPSQNLTADKATDPIGVMIKKFETTRPIGEPAPEFQDVDGIRKYFNTWVRGGLAKALKIKNPNTKLFDEAVLEMKQYTVSPDTVKKNAIIGDVSILDANSSNDKKKEEDKAVSDK